MDHVSAKPHTLLPRFFGLCQLGEQFFVVSENFFCSGRELHTRYDLKGSTVGRRASKKERCKGSLAILKDLDWLREQAADGLALEERDAGLLLNAIEHDCGFLAGRGLIDYSLVVGLSNDSFGHGRGAVASHEVALASGGLAVFGIIDVLVPYTAKKHLETFCLGTLCCGRNVSCQPPIKYSRRFVEFAAQHILPTAPHQLEDAPRVEEGMRCLVPVASADTAAQTEPAQMQRSQSAQSTSSDTEMSHVDNVRIGRRTVVHATARWSMVSHWPDLCEQLCAGLGVYTATGRDAVWKAWQDVRLIGNDGGRSGSSFFKASDGATLFKVVSDTEFARACKILPAIARHLMATQASSLLCPMLCAFDLTHLRTGRRWKVVGYPSLACLPGEDEAGVLGAPVSPLRHRMFDLKGTQEARRARPPNMVGKDDDLREALAAHGTLRVEGAAARAEFEAALAADTQLEWGVGNLYYSLLVGIYIYIYIYIYILHSYAPYAYYA